MKQAIRSLSRVPGLSVAAVITLALGVAFTTTMFSVVDAIVLKPLPFRDSERVVALSDLNTKSGARDEISATNVGDLAGATRTLQDVALWISEPVTIAGGAEPERVEALRVSPSIFQAWGVTPIIGRAFRSDENVAGRGAVVALSDAYWQSHFGGDPNIVGKSVRIDGIVHTIVGVLPSHFRFPAPDVALWQPLVLREHEWKFRGKRMFEGAARLAPNATLAEAKAEIASISAALAKDHVENRDWTTDVRLAREALARDARPLWLMLGAALLVLILACANVANLLLARASATRGDMEIRTALGATRPAVIAHYLREAAVLAFAGTVAGVLLAWRMIEFLAKIRPAGLATWNQLTLDVRALAAAAAALIVVTLVAGVVPAIASSREIERPMGTRFGVAINRGGRLRRVLTSAQVALAVVLLVCAVLLLRSMLAVQNVHTGFATDGRVAATIELPSTLYDDTREIALFNAFLDRVRTLPGVTAAGGITSLPLNRAGVDYSIETYLQGFTPGPREPEADFRLITPDYFRTMAIPVVEGREMLASDHARAPRVAIVNEAFARAYGGGRSPVGLEVRLYCPQCDPFRVVGVVRDTRHRALDRPVTPEIYLPFTQIPHGELTIVALTKGDPMLTASAMRQELMRLDSNLAMSNVATIDDIVRHSIDERRFNAQLLASFSLCALLLAAIGLYGSLSFAILQRRQEIAVRIALGATRVNVWRLVFTEAAKPVLIGLVVGVAGAALASASLRAMIFGITASDPVTYTVVVATFAAIALLVAFATFRRLSFDDVRRLLADA